MRASKILVVEDEEELRRFIRRFLELEGFLVLEASNGKRALEVVHQEPPDLVVTDLMMPEMDGVELYRTMKDKEETRAIPIIVLTVKDSFDDIRYAYLIGVDEYITKPFDPAHLVKRIREILPA